MGAAVVAGAASVHGADVASVVELGAAGVVSGGVVVSAVMLGVGLVDAATLDGAVVAGARPGDGKCFGGSLVPLDAVVERCVVEGCSGGLIDCDEVDRSLRDPSYQRTAVHLDGGDHLGDGLKHGRSLRDPFYQRTVDPLGGEDALDDEDALDGGPRRAKGR